MSDECPALRWSVSTPAQRRCVSLPSEASKTADRGTSFVTIETIDSFSVENIMPLRVARSSPFVLALALLGGAGATNPVTGRRELSMVSEAQEVQMGREASQGDLQRVGALNGVPAQTPVRRIGSQMAAKSERPTLP
jgi:hypothetical protein